MCFYLNEFQRSTSNYRSTSEGFLVQWSKMESQRKISHPSASASQSQVIRQPLFPCSIIQEVLRYSRRPHSISLLRNSPLELHSLRRTPQVIIMSLLSKILPWMVLDRWLLCDFVETRRQVIRAQRWGGIPTCLNEDTRMEPVMN